MKPGDVAFVMVRVIQVDEHRPVGRVAVCALYDGDRKEIQGDCSWINARALIPPDTVAERVLAKLGETR